MDTPNHDRIMTVVILAQGFKFAQPYFGHLLHWQLLISIHWLTFGLLAFGKLAQLTFEQLIWIQHEFEILAVAS